MNRVHQIVGLTLRRADRVANTHRAQHPSAGSHHVGTAALGARVKHLSGQPCRRVEPADGISLGVGVGISARRHDHTERGAGVPTGFDAIEDAVVSGLAKLDQIAL
jgi:hypothetical protein